MNKKQLYEAPEAEELFVKIEGNFCQSPGTGRSNYGKVIDLDGYDEDSYPM